MGFNNNQLDILIKSQKNNEAINFFKNYCKLHPLDYEAKINFIILLSNICWVDKYNRQMIWLENEMYQAIDELFCVEPYRAQAIIAQTEIELLFSFPSKNTYDIANDFLSSNPITVNYYGEVLMCKIFYLNFASTGKDEIEKNLLRSIDISPNYSSNYAMLGDIVFSRNDNKYANLYYDKAIQNSILVDKNIYAAPYDFQVSIDELVTKKRRYDLDYNKLLEKYEQTKT